MMAESSSENLIKDYVSSLCHSEDNTLLPSNLPISKPCILGDISCDNLVKPSGDMAGLMASSIASTAGAINEPTGSEPSSCPLSRMSSQGSSGSSKGRWKLESEDSSYDSDYENSELLSPQGECFPPCEDEAIHDEVSRTVSDTLAAEFAEYVNTRLTNTSGPDKESPQQTGNTRHFGQAQTDEISETPNTANEEEEEELDEDEEEDDSTMEAILLDPNYTSRVEFALKLGYTERQVQIALQKLGPQPGQNELLAELIKLGASVTSPHAADLSTTVAATAGTAVTDDSSITGDTVLRIGEGRHAGPRPDLQQENSGNFRSIVIDGSNVAMSHGNKEVFSCRGIKICVDWFKSRGHKEITVFVPKWRKEVSRPDARITDQEILLELEKERRLVFTPSRFVGGRRLVCYDDRYILKLAAATDGIVVSNDNYRDLANENPEYKKVVEERLLMYSFVNDRFMPPDDPLGRHGPSLDNFLRKPSKVLESTSPPCPYGKKCTYGNKCKYYHPERGNQPQKSVTERLVEQAKIQIQEVKARGNKSRDSSPGDSLKMKLTGTMSAPASSESKPLKKLPLSRTKSGVPQSLLPKDLIDSSSPTKKDETKSIEKEDCEKDFTGTDPKLSHAVGTFDIPTTSFHGNSSFQQKNIIHNRWNHSQVWPPIGMMSNLPTMNSGTSTSRLFSSDQGGHLSVAKRLSDPENKSEGSSEGPNLHRKLQRQLTLNPSCDPRLFQIHNYIPSHHMQMVQGASLNSGMKVESDPDSVIPCSVGLGGIESRDPSLTLSGHRPLTRHNSATEAHRGTSSMHPQVCWDKNAVIPMAAESLHTTVTRIASAPDSYCQWPSTQQRIPPIQRLNSTSDTQLNLYHENSNSYYGGNVFEPEQHQHHSWTLQNQAHLGSPHQWHHEAPTTSIPRPQTPLSHLSQPLRPSSVPPHQVTAHQQMSLQSCGDDHRSRLFFHLSSIFPQDQVRTAMMMYPEDVEVNPQELCATILSMFPTRNQ